MLVKIKPILSHVPKCSVRQSGNERHSVQGSAPQRKPKSEDAMGVSPWSFTFLNRSKKKILVLLFLAILLFFGIRFIVSLNSFMQKNRLSSQLLLNLVFDKTYPLKSQDNRTNFLLLGAPGQEHEGVDLTDTMIFLSIDFTKNDILLISLPRDIWLDSLKDKLNTAYHYGEEKKPGNGFQFVDTAVSEIVGQPVNYNLFLDFNGFKKLIDLVGGIDIDIENSFIDKKYPIPGRENDLCNGDKKYKCRYETITFEKGFEHMNGERALKYVRSRYAEGDEGTDFARSKRQQKVMMAFQKKLLTFNNITLNKASELIATLKETIKTDLTVSEAMYLSRFALSFKGVVRSIPLDWGNIEKSEAGFLISPPIDKKYDRWVLIPRTGDFTEIHNYITCYLKDPKCTISPDSPKK